jgi:hypothetical protein
MSNYRIFKIPRRRPHIVDLYAPLTQGLDTLGYRVKWAQNFDGSFAAIINSSNVGFLDPNVNRYKVETQPTTGTDVRIVFDPTTYGIDDTKSFWLQYAQVTGGTETLVSAPTLILPDALNKGQGVVTIQGNAPSGVTSANSLQLDFPFLMQNLQITNNAATGGTVLYVSSEQGGPEVAIGPGLGFYGYSTIYASQGSIWVRGGGATVNFSATSTLSFPR